MLIWCLLIIVGVGLYYLIFFATKNNKSPVAAENAEIKVLKRGKEINEYLKSNGLEMSAFEVRCLTLVTKLLLPDIEIDPNKYSEEERAVGVKLLIALQKNNCSLQLHQLECLLIYRIRIESINKGNINYCT